jgi:hypothetical protein
MRVQAVEQPMKSARYRSKKSVCLTSIAASLPTIHALRALHDSKTLRPRCMANWVHRVACAYG